jgi:large subunit ribosomal protein L3
MSLNGIVGKVIGGTQFYHEDGRSDQATAIQAGPCIITQIKLNESDTYESVQLGFGPIKKTNAPTKGHMAKSGGQAFRYLRELSAEDMPSLELGASIDVGIFEVGAKVNVTGTSKGKGFAGTVKRYNFKGGPKTHGQSDRHRAPGSIGAGSTPGRVIKGMRMAGRMGGDKVTVKNLEVLLVDVDRNLLLVKGSVPGHKDSILLINKSGQ